MKPGYTCLLAFVAASALTVPASLVQHLDGSVAGSVHTNASGGVTSWEDQSGSPVLDAAPLKGTVLYPSSPFPSGLGGLDFGLGRNSLTLMDWTTADSIFNCTSSTGFSVLVAFKVTELAPHDQFLMATRELVNNFGLIIKPDGTLQLKLGNYYNAAGGLKAEAGDALVMGVTYDTGTQKYRFWDSKNNAEKTGTETARDFCRGQTLKLGDANSLASSALYFHGLIGEVKIFNQALSDSEFVSERNAMTLKWANFVPPPPPVTAGWRVIADDPRFPSDDVIVAFCAVTDPVYNLPANTESNDCTAAFQAALDAASSEGAATVFVPEGIYRIEGELSVPATVELHGRWRELKASDTEPYDGTILALYGPLSAIKLQERTVFRDLTVWYPNQDPVNPVAYPPSIVSVQGKPTIENITLVNSYKGIDIPNSNFIFLRNIYGSPLNIGIYAGASGAVPRFENINFTPDYWTWSRLPGSPQNGEHKAYMRSNGIAYHLGGIDVFAPKFFTFSGYWKGLYGLGDGGRPHGEAYGCSITDCAYAVHLAGPHGIDFVHSTLEGSVVAVQSDASPVELNACAITNTTGGNAFVAPNHDVTLVNCSYSGGLAVGGDFKDLTFDRVAPQFDATYNKVRKPHKSDLFNVKAFGAVGNTVHDDTQAFKDAMAAAKANGGGIVLVPAGDYRLTEPLGDLGSGVEMRGTSRRADLKPGNMQSLLLIDYEPAANDTPFLVMTNDSGIRNLSFFPNRQTLAPPFKDYAFTVQCNGTNNYIIYCNSGNTYRFAELNGNNHLVDGSFVTGTKVAFQANHCSGGRIQNLNIKPFSGEGLPLGPPSPNYAALGKDYRWFQQLEGCTGIELNGCDDYSLTSIFHHGPHTFFKADNSGGQALDIAGEFAQNGYLFKNGAKTFNMIGASSSCSSIGDYTRSFGYKTEQSFNGQVNIFIGRIIAYPNDFWRVQGGQLNLQQAGTGSHQGGTAGWVTVERNGILNMEDYQAGDISCFERDGLVTMEDCLFADGFVHSHAVQYVRSNSIRRSFIITDFSSAPLLEGFPEYIREAGMASLNPGSLEQGETTDSAEQINSQRKRFVRTTDGRFSFDVTEPDFTNGKRPIVDFQVKLYVDGNGTLEVFYDHGGPQLVSGGFFSYNQAGKNPLEATTSFSLTNAWFGSTEDIRIVVTGDSPGLFYARVVSNKLPGGNIVLDNNDSSRSETKTWTVSNLNSTNPPVSGSSATATGILSAAGQFGFGESFSLTASSVINWDSAAAQSAISAGTFSNYLASLPTGRMSGLAGGDIGPDSSSVYTNDNPQTFGKGSKEALVYTVDTSNLNSGRLYLLSASWGLQTAGDRMDFVVYDASANKLIKQRWNADLDISGNWALDHGDKIIFGTGASNGANEYRISTLTLDVMIPVLNEYDAWAARFGGEGTIGAATNDYDGDGLVNFGEYAFDGNPTNRLDTGEAPALYNSGGTLVYVHPQRSDDDSLIYTVETSTNLVSGSWTNAGYVVLGTNVTGLTLNYVTNAIPSDQSQTYIRLKVEK